MPLHSGNGRQPPPSPPQVPRFQPKKRSSHSRSPPFGATELPKQARRIPRKKLGFDPPGMPPPADLKVEEPITAQLSSHAAMFQPVADLLSWTDVETPAFAYPNLLESWRDTSETILDESLRVAEVALTSKEASSLRVVKEIGYGVLEKFFAAARSVGWANQPVSVRREAVHTLLSRPQVPQRTEAWYLQGKQVLTASEFATLYKSPRSLGQLAMAKVLPTVPLQADAITTRPACLTCEMGPFDWGVRFEPVVKQILAKQGGVKIAEAGRLLHPNDPLLAASPDGLILEATDSARVGRLVEIKCPITRVIGEGVPFEYWCQMQIQMEVTGIGECEYVEVKLQSPTAQQGWPVATEGATEPVPDGYLWLLQHPTTAKMLYAYTEEERATQEEAGYEVLETVPWRLERLWTRIVPRDRAWFLGTADVRAKFWETVAAARAGTFTVPESTRAVRPSAAGGKLQIQVIKEGESGAAPTGAEGVAGVATAVASAPVCLIQDDDL